MDLEFDRLLVGYVRDRSCGHHAVFSGQEIDSTDREHLGSVLFGDNEADLSFACHHRGSLFTDRDVRIDLDHNAAVTEGSLRHHGHHIHVVPFSFDDVRGGLAVRGGCACADPRDQRPSNRLSRIRAYRVFDLAEGVDPCHADKLPALITVAPACARIPVLDSALDRAGVTLDSFQQGDIAGTDGLFRAHSHARAALATAIVNGRFFLLQADRTKRAVLNTGSAANATIQIDFHGNDAPAFKSGVLE